MARTPNTASPQDIASAKAEIASAAQALNANRPEIALGRMDKLLAKFPALAQAHALRATALMKLREVDLALAALGQATKYAPQSEELWTRYITDLHRAGQKGRARRVAGKATLKGAAKKRLKDLAKDGPNLATTSLGEVPAERVHEVRRAIEAQQCQDAQDLMIPLMSSWPDVAFLYNMRGIISMECEDFETAEIDFLHALQLSPTFAEAKANLGAALCRMDRFNDALRILRPAHAENPLDPVAAFNLSDALYQSGDMRTSMELVDGLLKKWPSNTTYLSHRARIFSHLGRHQQVLEVTEKIWAIDGVVPETLDHYLTSLSVLKGPGAALEFLEKADVTDDTTILSARYLGQIGDLEKARAILTNRVTERPDFTRAYGSIGKMGKWQKGDPLIAQMQRIFSSDELQGQRRIGLGFALGKALEDVGEFAKSFQVFKATNDLQHRGLGAWTSKFCNFVDDRIARWDAPTIANLRQKHAPAIRPIFIVGMPRTGSSLTEAIVGRHPDVFDLGEDQFTVTTTSRIAMPTQDSIRKLAELLGDNFRRRVTSHLVATDKHLSNSHHIGPICAALPNAKFVLVRRNPRAICLSIYQNGFSTYGHPYAMNLEDLAHHYVQFDRLMQHWKSVLDDQLIELKYEDLVADPDNQTRKLISDLDLPWDDACLSPEKSTSAVRTLSIGQVRQGVYDSSRDRWRKYEEELQPLIKILEEHGL